MAKKNAKAVVQEFHIPFKWHVPENIITRFASNMIIQTIENEFKISFFEINPEVHFGPSEPPPREVEARCVASVIVTADRLPKFIQVLQKHLDKYQLTKKLT